MDPYFIANFAKGFSALVGGCFFFYVGVLHFTDTEWFEPIVPPIFGYAKLWVLISGVAEIMVGVALVIAGFEIIVDHGTYYRERAGVSSALLLILLYPANLYMWIYDVELGVESPFLLSGILSDYYYRLEELPLACGFLDYPLSP